MAVTSPLKTLEWFDEMHVLKGEGRSLVFLGGCSGIFLSPTTSRMWRQASHKMLCLYHAKNPVCGACSTYYTLYTEFSQEIKRCSGNSQLDDPPPPPPDVIPHRHAACLTHH